MNKENFKDYVIDALSYFDGEEHDRKDSIELIELADDSIIVITKNDKSYLLNIVEIDSVLGRIDFIKTKLNYLKTHLDR